MHNVRPRPGRAATAFRFAGALMLGAALVGCGSTATSSAPPASSPSTAPASTAPSSPAASPTSSTPSSQTSSSGPASQPAPPSAAATSSPSPSAQSVACTPKGAVTEPVKATSGQHEWDSYWNLQSGCLYVRRSSDGGKTWKTTSVASHISGGISDVSMKFIDATHGWILVTESPGAGQAPRTLFRTTDGGAHWTQLKTNPSTFPMGDTDVHWTFTSALTGWMDTVNTFYGPPRLYVYGTADGGSSWFSSWVAVPKAYEGDQLTVSLPVMSSAKVGWINMDAKARQGNGSPVRIVFLTKDGGHTWAMAPSASPSS